MFSGGMILAVCGTITTTTTTNTYIEHVEEYV